VSTKHTAQTKAWTELFDPCERDHAIESIRRWVERRTLGYDDPKAASETIKEQIQMPLDAYVCEHNKLARKRFDQDRAEWLERGIKDHPREIAESENVIAAQSLLRASEQLSQTWQKPSATAVRLNNLIDDVFQCWTEFIVHGAASKMYHDAPKIKKQRVNAAKRPRKSARKIDRHLLATRAKSLLDTGKEKHELATLLAPKFGVSARAIRDALPIKFKNSKKKGS
jgi:hypothetical protein